MKSSVVISSYSEEWPRIFAQIREELFTVFSSTNTQIEHIGSTAVIGLCAKPVIDILLGANALSEIESKITSLEALGFDYISKYEKEIPTRREVSSKQFAHSLTRRRNRFTYLVRASTVS